MGDAAGDKLLNEGVAHLRAGRLDDAERSLRSAIELAPESVAVAHMLGLVHHARGRYESAVDLLTRAAGDAPRDAIVCNNLGEAHRMAGRPADALAWYERAAALRPELAAPVFHCGLALTALGRVDEATAAYQKTLGIDPRHHGALVNLGTLMQARGDPVTAEQVYMAALSAHPGSAEAMRNLAGIVIAQGRRGDGIALLQRAVAARGDFIEALDDLGSALQSAGQVEQAVELHMRALSLNGAYLPALSNLGNAMIKLGRLEDAMRCYRRAVEIDPSFADAWYNLGSVAQTLERHDEAAEGYGRSAELRPRLAAAHNNHANVLKDQGRLAEAIAAFARAGELGERGAASNMLYTMLYADGVSPEAATAAHAEWGRRWADPLGRDATFDLDRTPGRRLRIGYVSPYFRMHALGILLDPIVRAHDPAAVELVFYSDSTVADGVTARFKACAAIWRDIAGVSDVRLAEQIRADRIDVLVDLTLHMAHGRLGALARRPAPVQLSYLAYPATSGMRAMDGVITDIHLDPPDNDAHYVERAIRLPHCYWCYAPGDPTPDVAPLPADANGFITFGELNNYCKINAAVARAWGRVLAAVPGSRLRVLMHGDVAHNDGGVRTLTDNGVPRDRIDFIGYQPREKYLAEYGRIDIVLDPFPCNGHTSSLDALWMGAPTVSLAGSAAFGRAGVSLLRNLGLDELLAKGEDDYVRIAAELANNLPRLRTIRAGLRARMIASPIHDAARQARDLETVYRAEWTRWCAAPAAAEAGQRRPTVSVCIVLLNRSRRRTPTGETLTLFPNCVRSLRDSTPLPQEIELVVADFGSTDWPLDEWLEREAGGMRVRVVRCDGAFSRGRGRNAAARAATGEVLFFCDADMCVPPGMLSDLAEMTRGGAAVFPLCTMLDAQSRPTGVSATGFGNALMRRETFDRTAGWPEYESWGGEDNLFWDTCRRLAPAARPTVPGFVHQWHPDRWNDEASTTPRLSEWKRDVGEGAMVNAPAQLTVACVLRVSRLYTPTWVHRLRRGVARHLRRAHRFVCLTDTAIEGVETVPLIHGWEGFWSKIELFRPGVFSGPTLYIDLDTVLCGDLEPLCGPFDFDIVMQRDYRFPDRMNSSTMWMRPERLGFVYDRFAADPAGCIAQYQRHELWADQGHIEIECGRQGVKIGTWDALTRPGFLKCFSHEIIDRNEGWADTSLVYGAWHPKPNDMPNHPLVRDHWI